MYQYYCYEEKDKYKIYTQIQNVNTPGKNPKLGNSYRQQNGHTLGVFIVNNAIISKTHTYTRDNIKITPLH